MVWVRVELKPRQVYAGGLVLGMVCFLVGCSTGGVIPPRPLIPLSTSLPIERAWTRVNLLEDAPGQVVLPLKYVEGRLYWTDTGNILHAVDARSGHPVWRYRSEIPLISGVGGNETLLLIGSREGDVVALDAAQGTRRWQTRLSSEVLSPPQLGNGVVVAYAVDGKIFALDADTGKIRWQFDTQVPLLTLRGLATPRIVDDRVLVGLANGRLLALQLADGKNIWSAEIAPARGRSELERMVDVDTTPLVLGDTVYCVAFQGQITAVSVATGRVMWARDLSSAEDMTYDDTALYITDPDGVLTAVTRQSGEVLWRQDALQYRRVTGPARLGEYLVVGDVEGYLHWIERSTGSLVHRKRLDNTAISSDPIVVDDHVFVLTHGGVLDAWRLPVLGVAKTNGNGAS